MLGTGPEEAWGNPGPSWEKRERNAQKKKQLGKGDQENNDTRQMGKRLVQRGNDPYNRLVKKKKWGRGNPRGEHGKGVEKKKKVGSRERGKKGEHCKNLPRRKKNSAKQAGVGKKRPSCRLGGKGPGKGSKKLPPAGGLVQEKKGGEGKSTEKLCTG